MKAITKINLSYITAMLSIIILLGLLIALLNETSDTTPTYAWVVMCIAIIVGLGSKYVMTSSTKEMLVDFYSEHSGKFVKYKGITGVICGILDNEYLVIGINDNSGYILALNTFKIRCWSSSNIFTSYNIVPSYELKELEPFI